MLSAGFDIRQYKKDLRQKYKAIRGQIEPQEKAAQDEAILNAILAMPEYKNAKNLITYVSLPAEVDTRRLIETALRDGKTVAVPYCVEGTHKMIFYRISSLEELVERTMGVLEPDPQLHKKLKHFSDSLCILPGLCFDRQGYRLGYGGGYYDRFLSKVYRGVTVGVCYCECVVDKLHHGRFDVACTHLVVDGVCTPIFAKHKKESPS